MYVPKHNAEKSEMLSSWRNIRVFISSTFKDMHAERNHLVRVVFPELKKLCKKKRVHLIDVDLRWGVSEEDAREGNALNICLDEIDSCRPFFLGLLGHRYGWVPKGKKDSITASEIYHGVLRNDLPEQVIDLQAILDGRLEGRQLSTEQIACLIRCYPYDGEKRKYILQPGICSTDTKIIQDLFRSFAAYQQNRSFFFFRSEALSKELGGPDFQDFFESDQVYQDRLAVLKQEIKDRGLWWTEYTHIEPIDEDDRASFGSMVKEVLWQKIKAELGQESEPRRDWLEIERDLHHLFMSDRTHRFVGRSEDLARMQKFCQGDSASPILVVIGEPGCGKSALLARFSDQTRRIHPDWLIINHFVGASPGSTNLRHSLRRIFGEINNHINLEDEIPENIRDLVSSLSRKLKQAAQFGPTVLIIDAVNQFEHTDEAAYLRWLPFNLPETLRIVISTPKESVPQAILDHGPEILEVTGLSSDDTEALVSGYLNEVRKQFPRPEDKAAFLAKLSSGNPLYIIVALEELRVFENFEMISQRIAELPDEVPALFDQVLDRVESDFKRFPGLVRDALSLISCGRQGIAPEELQNLLVSHAPEGLDKEADGRLPDMIMARLLLSLDPYLFKRSGVVDFFHYQLKKAVELRWLKKEATRITFHHMIASYFEARWQEPYARALDELPHQLIKATDWDGLAETLCNLDFIQQKCAANMLYDLLADYTLSLNALPENQMNIQLEKDQQARLEKFAKELTVYAGEGNENLEVISSVNIESEDELWKKRHMIAYYPNRSDTISAFKQFMESEALHFQQFGVDKKFFYAQACGHAFRSPVASAAGSTVALQSLKPLIFRHPSWLTLFNPLPACRKIMKADNDRQIYEGEKGMNLSLALSPDGRLAISGNGDGTIRVWDLNEYRCLHTMEIILDASRSEDEKYEARHVSALALSLDGNLIVSGHGDGTLVVWERKTGRCLKTFPKHTGWVYSLALIPGTRRVMAATSEPGVKIWDLETGALQHSIMDSENVRCLALAIDGRASSDWVR